MSSGTSRLPLLVLGLVVLFTLNASQVRGETWWAQAGWVHSDVGLADEGDGIWVGVEGLRPLGTGLLELGYSVSYAQVIGSQTMLFSDEIEGNQLGPAEVTLHSLQPAVTLGLIQNLGPVRGRLYGGAAVNLKLSEKWSTPAGEADRQYSYENLDLALRLGLSLGSNGFMVDLHYNAGLLDQLLVEGVVPADASRKADDPLGGASLPEAGEKISSWSLGVGYGF